MSSISENDDGNENNDIIMERRDSRSRKNNKKDISYIQSSLNLNKYEVQILYKNLLINNKFHHFLIIKDINKF